MDTTESKIPDFAHIEATPDTSEQTPREGSDGKKQNSTGTFIAYASPQSSDNPDTFMAKVLESNGKSEST